MNVVLVHTSATIETPQHNTKTYLYSGQGVKQGSTNGTTQSTTILTFILTMISNSSSNRRTRGIVSTNLHILLLEYVYPRQHQSSRGITSACETTYI